MISGGWGWSMVVEDGQWWFGLVNNGWGWSTVVGAGQWWLGPVSSV